MSEEKKLRWFFRWRKKSESETQAKHLTRETITTQHIERDAISTKHIGKPERTKRHGMADK